MSDLIERLVTLTNYWNQRDALTGFKAVEMACETIVVTNSAAWRIKELESEQERAFGMLAAHGVPKERAKTVANGIDVLTTRFRKAEAAMESSLAAAVAEREATERDAGRWQAFVKQPELTNDELATIERIEKETEV